MNRISSRNFFFCICWEEFFFKYQSKTYTQSSFQANHFTGCFLDTVAATFVMLFVTCQFCFQSKHFFFLQFNQTRHESFICNNFGVYCKVATESADAAAAADAVQRSAVAHSMMPVKALTVSNFWLLFDRIRMEFVISGWSFFPFSLRFPPSCSLFALRILAISWRGTKTNSLEIFKGVFRAKNQFYKVNCCMFPLNQKLIDF